MFVVVCTSCRDCNSQAVSIFENEPTQEQIDEVLESIGGMQCINSIVYELTYEEIITAEIYPR